MTGPLQGLLVVALEQAVAAPFCTSRLADAGARVIKIERAEGDFARDYDHVVHGESAYFVWLNRGKQSIALDLKSPDDARLCANMIARADVFVQNIAPGAAARLGLGADALRAVHPRLITCDISGYGEDGPWADMKAYDLLIQAESGLASITGSKAEPGRVGVSVADICCGMNAHAAILQALFERERSGRGRGVSVSLFDGLADWMTVPLLHQDYGKRAPSRVGMNHPSIAPYGAYAVGDGRTVVLAIQNQREWRSFCDVVLGQSALAADPAFESNELRCVNRQALDAKILATFETLAMAALTDLLRKAKIAFGEVRDVGQLSSHPQLRRVEVGTPSGPVRMPAPPWRWRDADAAALGPAPALDEHGGAIRAEFSDQ